MTLSIDDMRVIKWYVDASFSVNPFLKSYTGCIMMWGTWVNQYRSMKQKLNTIYNPEFQFVGVNDMESNIFRNFFYLGSRMQCWGEHFYQDNKNYILLDKNGLKRSDRRIRAVNICYFFIMDQAEKGNLEIGHCPTDGMVAYFMTKPLQG